MDTEREGDFASWEGTGEIIEAEERDRSREGERCSQKTAD